MIGVQHWACTVAKERQLEAGWFQGSHGYGEGPGGGVGVGACREKSGHGGHMQVQIKLYKL